jgi:hypothetical protein
MTAHQKQLFPHIPEEIFDPWVAARFEHYGWPYPADDSDYLAWNRNFGDITLRGLAKLHWRKDECTLSGFNEEWRPGATGIKEFAVLGTASKWSTLKDTKQRFWSSVEFIRKNGTIPGSLVGVQLKGSICIWDGSHRLAALLHLRDLKERVPELIPVWVALRPA